MVTTTSAAPAAVPEPSTITTIAADLSSPALQGFSWPSDGPLGTGFQIFIHPVHGTERLHAGQDFQVPIGTSVVAARGGSVVVAGPQGGFGNTVVIDHGQGTQTRYAHLDEVLVAVGDELDDRQEVGLSGQTGNATGPVLHFQVLADGNPIDPLLVLPER